MSSLRTVRAFSSQAERAIRHVVVIGAGHMGSGIAQVAAQSGIKATIVDFDREVLQKSEINIQKSLQSVAKKLYDNNEEEKKEKFISETLDRLKISTNLYKSVQDADLVVESIIEKLDLKMDLFRKLDNVAPEHTILASNTSVFLISEIAAEVKRRDKVGGTHFFYPVPDIKLLEIVRIPETSDETYNTLIEWGQKIGKTTVTCKDKSGFIVNRLLVPIKAEASRMLERGDASTKDIDTAMKLGAGYPVGPLEHSDYAGLDTFKYILDDWHEKYPDNVLFKPVDLVNKMVAEGKLGRKTGEGFYKYK